MYQLNCSWDLRILVVRLRNNIICKQKVLRGQLDLAVFFEWASFARTTTNTRIAIYYALKDVSLIFLQLKSIKIRRDRRPIPNFLSRPTFINTPKITV